MLLFSTKPIHIYIVYCTLCDRFIFLLSFSTSDLHFILCELLRDVAVHSETTVTTDEIISKVVDVSLDLHKQMQQSFYREAVSGSLFSLTDLTRVFYRVSTLAARMDSVEDFLLLWQHESFWAYSSKLSSDADVARYLDTAAMAIKKQFSSVLLVCHCYLPCTVDQAVSYTECHQHNIIDKSWLIFGQLVYYSSYDAVINQRARDLWFD